MDLRRRERPVFSGFSDGEVAKLENLYGEYRQLSVNKDFCQKVVKSFNRSAGRAGKPVVKLAEVQNWFQNRLQQPDNATPASTNKKESGHNMQIIGGLAVNGDASDQEKAVETNQVDIEEKMRAVSELEFEARSSRDGAWYDVDRFITHRYSTTGEAEVRVRFVGFGSEEDEWVVVKKHVRERSVPLENWDCQKVKVGDLLLCLQERKDQAMYYDGHIVDIQRKMHDIRGCRCIFSIQYDHDKSEEKVRLRRLCRILR